MNSPRKILDYISATKDSAGGSLIQLLPGLRMVIQARLKYGIGPRFFSLYELKNIPREEWGEFIIEEQALEELKSVNVKTTQKLTRDKLRFTEHCAAQGLPTIPIVLVQSNGQSLPAHSFPNGNELHDWKQILEGAPAQLFVKQIDGAHGAGAFSATRNASGWTFSGINGDIEDFYAYCKNNFSSTEGCLIQPVVTPHHSLSGLMPNGCLGTLRATTYLENNQPKIFRALLKIPVNGNITDNFSLGATGNLISGICLAKGTLLPARYAASRTWPAMRSTDTHPDTGERITDRQVPFWSEIQDLLLSAQEKTPLPKTIGWDIAITDEGPVIVEANSIYGTDIFQVAFSKGLRTDFMSLMTALKNT